MVEKNGFFGPQAANTSEKRLFSGVLGLI